VNITPNTLVLAQNLEAFPPTFFQNDAS